MEELFELMTIADTTDSRTSVRLGIRLKAAGNEALCPVTKPCETYEEFDRESQILIGRLEQIRRQARNLLKSASPARGPAIHPDMPAKEIWDLLSTITDEAAWVASFNELTLSQRKAVAEHVLTHCNIFSGKAAVFSSRYDNETGLM